MTISKPCWPARWWWLALLALLIFAGGLRYTGYNFSLPYVDHVDEPAYNLAGRMIIDFGSAKPLGMHGYPPGIVTLNYVLLKLFQDPATPPSTLIGPVRLISITFSLGVLVLIALLGYRIATPLAGLLAAGLWTVFPDMVEHSRYATPDNFVTFFTLLALFLMISATRYDRDKWATYGIVAIMFAIIFKYQAVFVTPLILGGPLWRLVYQREKAEVRRILRNFGNNVFYLSLFFLWLLLIYPALDATKSPDWSAPVERLAFPTWNLLHTNLERATTPLQTHLWIPSLLGLTLLLWPGFRKKNDLWGVLVIIGGGVLWWFGVSFWGIQVLRQFISLTALITVLCGMGLAAWAVVLERLWERLGCFTPVEHRAWLIPGVVFVIGIGASWPEITASIDNAHEHTLHDRRNDLATYMDTSLTPGSYISDLENHKTFNEAWGGYTGKNEFPYIKGLVTERPVEEWRQQGITYAIMPYYIYERIQRSQRLQAYRDELLLLKSYPPSTHYRGPSMVVYRLSPIQHQAAGSLGPIRLVGYDIDHTEVKPGETLTFTLYWQVTETPAADYTVYNHLTLPDSRDIVAQIDGSPLPDTRRPTQTWNDPGETLISQPFTLTVGPEVAPGEYRLISGFYRRDTWERLLAPSGDDFLTITSINVVK